MGAAPPAVRQSRRRRPVVDPRPGNNPQRGLFSRHYYSGFRFLIQYLFLIFRHQAVEGERMAGFSDIGGNLAAAPMPPPSFSGWGHFFAVPLIYWKELNMGGHGMKQNNQPNLQQLLGDKKAMEQLAKSPDAKALASMLTRSQDQASLKQIAEKAAKGDTAQLNQLIQSIVRSPGGAELLQRLNSSLEQR